MLIVSIAIIRFSSAYITPPTTPFWQLPFNSKFQFSKNDYNDELWSIFFDDQKWSQTIDPVSNERPEELFIGHNFYAWMAGCGKPKWNRMLTVGTMNERLFLTAWKALVTHICAFIRTYANCWKEWCRCILMCLVRLCELCLGANKKNSNRILTDNMHAPKHTQTHTLVHAYSSLSIWNGPSSFWVFSVNSSD